MNNQIKFISNFSENSFYNKTPFYEFYEFLKNNQWVSFYFKGKKYFVFAWRGRIFSLSEFQLSLMISTLVFLITIAIRKLCKRTKLRKKIFRLIKKLRGGNNIPIDSIMELVDENNIRHYENKLPAVVKYNPLPIYYFSLTSKEKLIRSIIKKCLKPGHMYKITHRGILEILDKMMDFKKTNNIKLISYDVFVLSLIIVFKPISRIAYQGIAEFLKKSGSPFALEHFPLVSSGLISLWFALKVNLNVGLVELTINLFFVLVKSSSVYKIMELVRSESFIDCTDYVKQLPQKNLKELPHAENLSEIDSSSLSSSKNLISYTREEPTRYDAFVSTSPNQQLHFKDEIKIETLDGEIRRVHTLKGEIIEYVKDREPAQCIKSTYIPLNERTRTLDDVKNLDTTMDRESVSKITKTILEEQIKANLLLESLNGE